VAALSDPVDDAVSAPIGIFDSGVGGLSVLREIRAQLPCEALAYVADSGFGPYGDRNAGYIEQRCVAITEFLLAIRAKAIVVACNTATAAIVPLLRQRTSVPIVAIEPAVKPAANLSRTGVIGVLATRQTLASDRFSRLLAMYAGSVSVLPEPCPDLVDLVERGETEGREAAASVAHHVAALVERRADVIVLGCTHFHFLRMLVERAAGPGVEIVDPGIPVALELRRRLDHAGLLRRVGGAGTERFWTSGDPGRGRAVFGALLEHPCQVEPLPARYCEPPTV